MLNLVISTTKLKDPKIDGLKPASCGRVAAATEAKILEDLGPPKTTASFFISNCMNKYISTAAPDSFSLNLGFWNVEGIVRNRLAIQYLFHTYVQVLCLSKLNGPDSSISLVLQEYPSIRFCSSHNSETNSGRSAILWKSDLDPIITQ